MFPPSVAIAVSRHWRSVEGPTLARAVLERSLRADNWRDAGLWFELVSLMEAVADYRYIRDLWWDAPPGARERVPIIRAVARAACLGAAHEEARALLRQALLSPSAKLRDGRSRWRGGRRRPNGRAPQAKHSFETRAQDALTQLLGRLDTTGARCFIISGTLLGKVRDGGIIPWDKDIDVGVLAEEVEVADIEKVLVSDPSFAVRRVDLTTDRLRVKHANSVQIDIFPHYRDDDGLVWHDGAATRWWNTPFDLSPVEFLGVRCRVPEPAVRYLEENYGKWEHPDPEFDARLDAPNVEVTDADHLTTLLYFSLLAALRAENSVKEARYKRLLRETGEGPWLDRV